MKNISREAKLSKCYTNHSIRATAVTILDKSGFEARHIMVVSGHKNEASIRSYSKTGICAKKETSETLTTRCEVSEELSVMNSHQPSPVHSLSQEDVTINSSRSEITKNFNFFNCNVNIQWSWPFQIICKIFSMFSISFPCERFKNFLLIYADLDFLQRFICFRLWKNLLDALERTTGCKLIKACKQ